MSYYLQRIVLGAQFVVLIAWFCWDGYRRMREGDWSFLLNIGGFLVVVLLLQRTFKPPCDCDCAECIEEHG